MAGTTRRAFGLFFLVPACLVGGTALADMAGAEQAWVDERYAKAAQELIQPAHDGDAEAQFMLGLLYSGGQGLVEDDKDAARWLSQAAEQNHAKAQVMLAQLYLQGAGVEQDVFAAMRWLYLAKRQDNAEAADLYGQIAGQLPDGLVAQISADAEAWAKKKGY